MTKLDCLKLRDFCSKGELFLHNFEFVFLRYVERPIKPWKKREKCNFKNWVRNWVLSWEGIEGAIFASAFCIECLNGCQLLRNYNYFF